VKEAEVEAPWGLHVSVITERQFCVTTDSPSGRPAQASQRKARDEVPVADPCRRCRSLVLRCRPRRQVQPCRLGHLLPRRGTDWRLRREVRAPTAARRSDPGASGQRATSFQAASTQSQRRRFDRPNCPRTRRPHRRDPLDDRLQPDPGLGTRPPGDRLCRNPLHGPPRPARAAGLRRPLRFRQAAKKRREDDSHPCRPDPRSLDHFRDRGPSPPPLEASLGNTTAASRPLPQDLLPMLLTRWRRAASGWGNSRLRKAPGRSVGNILVPNCCRHRTRKTPAKPGFLAF